MPRSSTSDPTDRMPEHSASFSMTDEVRGSLATAILPPSSTPTALPMRRASSQPMSTLATPLTPFVPNILSDMGSRWSRLVDRGSTRDVARAGFPFK